MGSSTDVVASAAPHQWAQLSPDARALLSQMSPEDRLVLLGGAAAPESPKKLAPAPTSPPTSNSNNKESRRGGAGGFFRRFSGDGTPSPRRSSTTTSSSSNKNKAANVEFVMECPIQITNKNVDETENSGDSDPVVNAVVAVPCRRNVRRHVSSDGIPMHQPTDNSSSFGLPRGGSKQREPTQTKRGVRRHVSSDGIPMRHQHQHQRRGEKSAEFIIECDLLANKRKSRKGTKAAAAAAACKLDDDIDNGSYKNFR